MDARHQEQRPSRTEGHAILPSTSEDATVAPSESEDAIVTPSETFHLHDIRSIQVNRLSGLSFAAVVGVVVSVASVIVTLSMGGFGLAVMIIMGVGGVITAMLFASALFWPRLEYNRAGWRLDAVGLQIRRGVIWRHQISIPIARVQHADVSQGPLQRHFGLATLTVHTAGTQNAQVGIAGLRHETALEVRDKLVAQRRAGHVV